MTSPVSGRPGDNVARGIGLCVTAIAVFGVQDAVTKLLVADYSPFQITMMRYWAMGAVSLWLVMRQGPLREALVSGAPLLQTLRAVLLVLDIMLFSFATRSVPLAELQAIILIYPLLVTLFAVPLLGERVGVFRITAVAIGFLGAMVIVRPGGLPFDFGVVQALLAATAYALYLVLTRRVSARDSTATSIAYMALIGLVLTSAVGVFFWQPMDLRGLLLALFVMTTSVVAHMMMIEALRLAPASVLQPFNYLVLPWAIPLSFLIFGHMIDGVALVGALVIVGAGLVVMARERHLARKVASGKQD